MAIVIRIMSTPANYVVEKLVWILGLGLGLGEYSAGLLHVGVPEYRTEVGVPKCRQRPAECWRPAQSWLFLPPSWRHAHAHFGFAHRQQPLRWLKPFLKHWYVKLYELIAPHTLKWMNSVIKLGHFVWNIIYCLSRIEFKDRWLVFFIYDSFCWTKSPTAAGLGSRNDAM